MKLVFSTDGAGLLSFSVRLNTVCPSVLSGAVPDLLELWSVSLTCMKLVQGWKIELRQLPARWSWTCWLLVYVHYPSTLLLSQPKPNPDVGQRGRYVVRWPAALPYLSWAAVIFLPSGPVQGCAWQCDGNEADEEKRSVMESQTDYSGSHDPQWVVWEKWDLCCPVIRFWIHLPSCLILLWWQSELWDGTSSGD